MAKEKRRINLWATIIKNQDALHKFLYDQDVVYITRESIPIAKYAKKANKNIKVIYHLHGYLPLSYNSISIFPHEKTMKDLSKVSTYIAFKNNTINGFASAAIGKLITWYARKTLDYVDVIVCVSKRQKEILSMSIPFLKKRLTYIYNPIPDDIEIQEKLPDDTPSFIYLGGDSLIKGFEVLLKALQKLVKMKVSFKAYLANRYSQNSIRKIHDVANSKNVYVVGKLGRGKLKDLYNKTWALLFPSIHEEPLPYAIMEAMLTGNIPIASRVGGVPELMNSNFLSNFLVKPYSPEDLLKKISFIINMDNQTIKERSRVLKTHIKSLIQDYGPEEKLAKLFGG